LILNYDNYHLRIEMFTGQAVERVRQKGYKVVCGRWLVEGNPQVILFDVGSASHKMAEFKHELYEKAGIGIPHDDQETNDVVVFGYVKY
jgi:glycogen(starch) synthase